MSYFSDYLRAQTEFMGVYMSLQGTPTDPKRYFSARGIAYKTRLQPSGVELTQIKYGPVCKFEELWMHASRGTTIVKRDGSIRGVVFCLNKFFNLGEVSKYLGHKAPKIAKALETEGCELMLMNKEDGTNIKTFYDEYGTLHSLTLGSVDPTIKMQGSVFGSPTYNGLSIQLLERKYPQILAYLRANPYVALVSELKSIWNVIVTSYTFDGDSADITPLCIIERDGMPRFGQLRTLCPERFDMNGLPLGSMMTTAATFSVDKERFFDDLAKNPEQFGVNPEGFVAYAFRRGDDGLPDSCIPWLKGKREEYITVHRGVSLNAGSTRDLLSVQRLVLEGKYDDEADCLAKDARNAHAEEFTKALEMMSKALNDVWPQLLSATTPKEYAEVINSLPQCLRWITNHLFRLRGKVPVVDEMGQYLVETLLAPPEGQSRMCVSFLAMNQTAAGLRWWVVSDASGVTRDPKVVSKASRRASVTKPLLPIPSETSTPVERDFRRRALKAEMRFLVITDFDGTFATVPLGSDYEILNPFTAIAPTVNMLKAYKVMNARIAVVTGRHHSLSAGIAEFVQATLGFEVEVYCRPDGFSTVSHKRKKVLDLLTDDIGTVVHFEDMRPILQSTSKIVNLKGVRYIGIHVHHGVPTSIITHSEASVIVTLVQPTGSGKTTILNRVREYFMAQDRQVAYISPDEIHRELHDELTARDELPIDGAVPPGLMYSRLMSKFSEAINTANVTIVDMCHDRSDMLKTIFTCGAVPIVRTFMEITQTKDRRGKVHSTLNPEQAALYRANVEARIARRNAARTEADKLTAMNSSTLIDTEAAVGVLKRKIEGCVQQVLTRGVTVLKSGTLEEMTQLLITDVEFGLHGRTSAEIVSAYLGIPAPIEDLSVFASSVGEDFWAVTYPHVTLHSSTTKLDDLVSRLGVVSEMKVSEPIMTPNTLSRVVTIGDVRHHITLMVRNGHSPYEAYRETRGLTPELCLELSGAAVLL